MTRAPKSAPPTAITCVRYGLNWLIDWRGSSVRVKNSIGTQRLTVLLSVVIEVWLAQCR